MPWILDFISPHVGDIADVEFPVRRHQRGEVEIEAAMCSSPKGGEVIKVSKI